MTATTSLTADNKAVEVKETSREREYRNERMSKLAKVREEYAKKAKENGYTVRKNLKTTTLKRMAEKKNTASASSMPKKENIVAALRRRGMSVSQAWKTVNSKYGSLRDSLKGKSTKDVIDLFK